MASGGMVHPGGIPMIPPGLMPPTSMAAAVAASQSINPEVMMRERERLQKMGEFCFCYHFRFSPFLRPTSARPSSQ